MNALYRLSSKSRLITGSAALGLGVLSLLYVYKYDTGFLEGFITGILIGVGFGLIMTYKKKE